MDRAVATSRQRHTTPLHPDVFVPLRAAVILPLRAAASLLFPSTPKPPPRLLFPSAPPSPQLLPTASLPICLPYRAASPTAPDPLLNARGFGRVIFISCSRRRGNISARVRYSPYCWAASDSPHGGATRWV
jgi:hypothetical protein